MILPLHIGQLTKVNVGGRHALFYFSKLCEQIHNHLCLDHDLNERHPNPVVCRVNKDSR